MELHDVRISIPLGSSAVPEIATIDGSHRHMTQEGTLLWTMDLLDQSNRTGSLEFNIASRDAEAFFPITVTFASNQLFCDVQVSFVVCLQNNGQVIFLFFLGVFWAWLSFLLLRRGGEIRTELVFGSNRCRR